MAGRESTLRKLLKESTPEARVFTNVTLLKAEKNIRMVKDGTESEWSMQGECSHPAGSYGWLADVLLSGFTAMRTDEGDIVVARQSQVVGDVKWTWS